MKEHKESEEKRSRKEEKEMQQQQPAREPFPIDAVDNRLRREAWAHGIIRKDLVEAAGDMGICAAEVNCWLKYMHNVNWKMKDGLPVTWRNFRRSLRMWHEVEVRINARCQRRTTSAERAEELRRAADAERLKKMCEEAKKPEAWALCRERCAFAEACGCAKKHMIPPQLRSHPIPPEECAEFAAKVEGGAK